MLKRQKAKMLIKLDEEKSAGGTTRAAKRARSAVSACSTPPVPVAAILPMAYAEPIVHVPCVAVPKGECEGEIVRCVIAQLLYSLSISTMRAGVNSKYVSEIWS